MCFALDMPCGASGIYIISNLRKQIYRIRKADISILRSKNIDEHPMQKYSALGAFCMNQNITIFALPLSENMLE